MKGRMFVVDSTTLQSTITTQIASIKTPDLQGAQWLKTLSDIMADMLQVEIGDYIFLWETRAGNVKSRIHGVYRAISAPYYSCTTTQDDAPFKIHIEKAYDFSEPIDEYDVLNCPYIKSAMWTITGKKVAGKSRGTSPLSEEEIKHLITLLIGKNPSYQFHPFNVANVINVANPICINYSNTGTNTRPASLSMVHPNDLNYFKSNGDLYYEKTIETIFNQEMARKNQAFFAQIGVDVNKVVWYSNYLPYSIEQSEMDYVIIESEDGVNYSKIFVVEFQAQKIDEDHIHRCLMYSKWVNDTLALGTSMVQPILICPESYDFISGETHWKKKECKERFDNFAIKNQNEYALKPLQVYQYSFVPKQTFTRKR